MKKPLALIITVFALTLTSCASNEGETTPSSETSSFEAVMGDSIVISTPAAGDSISSPFSVTGSTDHPDTSIKLVAYGVDGEINTESNWHTDSDGNFDFGSTYYFIGGGGEGRIEVFLQDEDETEIDRAILPVVFE